MLEVEVLEVQRSRLRELGLDWPDAISRGILQQTLTTTTSTAAGFTTSTLPGGTLAPGYIDLGNRSGLVNFVANPALTANIKGTSGDTNVLANPRIRVKNREKAKIHIGEKLPVFTTTSTANVGVSASVSYLDVGIKLDVEPNVSLSEEVSIKVGLEVSSIVKEVPGPSGSLAYQVGTRSAATSLRLKNGETQVLAGLISDEERNTSNHIPGIGELPILKHLFGTQRDTSTKTEIMLLITPRILRNIHRPEFVDPVIGTGTETAVGAPPMKVRTTGPRSLGISSQGGAITGTPARATEAPADTGSEAQAQKAAPAAENGNVVAVEAGTAEAGNGAGNTATNSNPNANAAGEPAADASAPAGAAKAPQ
jgi:general secretion pathway protein D